MGGRIDCIQHNPNEPHKHHIPTSNSPHHHQQIRTTFRVVEPNKTTPDLKENPAKPKHSPQLTTNPEHPFLPQPIGPTTAIDFPSFQKRPSKNPP
jgi:hypothetical protein